MCQFVTSLVALVASTLGAEEVAMTELGEGRFQIGKVIVSQTERSITIPAKVHMREGPVEYLLVTPRSKAHEAVFLSEADPFHVHLAALLLGLGKEGEDSKAVTVEVRWKANGPDGKLALEKSVLLTEPHKGETLQAKWSYGPKGKEAKRFVDAPFVSIIHDPTALIQYGGKSRGNDEIHVPNGKALPKVGHPVRVVVRVK
ncbi:MAG: YdjY domain-containing protein [Verrucomicrobiaceae bacterium]